MSREDNKCSFFFVSLLGQGSKRSLSGLRKSKYGEMAVAERRQERELREGCVVLLFLTRTVGR